MKQLSILILTIEERKDFLEPLMAKLTGELNRLSLRDHVDYYNIVEILKDPRGKGFSKGQKRNDLLQTASGAYVCFVDDDDDVADDFIDTLLEGIKSGPDCLSLRGIMTTDGMDPQTFEHSLKYTAWKDNGAAYPAVRYERYPNHLNAIRADIAKQFPFPEIDFSEDYRWSTAVHKSGLLKREIYIDKVLYHYKYRSRK